MICLIMLAARLLQCNRYQRGSFKASQQLSYATLYSHALNAQQVWVTQAMQARRAGMKPKKCIPCEEVGGGHAACSLHLHPHTHAFSM